MATRTPPPAPRNATLAVGVAALVVGFVAGTLVGRESARAPAATAPAAHGGQAGHAHDHAGDAPAGAHGVTRGHTFTGDVATPPHGPAGHDLAGQVLSGVTCPCGGCGGMDLAVCECDVAKELHGVVAHLLERGTAGDAVLRDLEGHYGLVLTPETLARAANVKLATGGTAAPSPGAPAPPSHALPAARPGDDVADFLQGGPAPARRPRDVPTSARGN